MRRALPARVGVVALVAASAAMLATAADQPAAAPPPAAASATDFSAAERLVFMDPHLSNTRPGTTLRYGFRKSGSLEPAFDDKVAIELKPQEDGRCCAAHGEFLSGTHRVELPDLPEASSNPVLLYFLERDIREMNRLTKGQQNYFRKRIRMAMYQDATVRDAGWRYRGQGISGREVVLTPYVGDPNQHRFERFVPKVYRFMLSSAVPGGVYGVRTEVADKAGGAPLLVEELLIDGAEPSPGASPPAAAPAVAPAAAPAAAPAPSPVAPAR